MMRGILAFLFLVAIAPPGQAAPVLTGSHPGFTRVVVPLPPGQTWQFGRTPTGYGLRLSEPATLDLSTFFRRISRDRIGAVRQSGNELNIDLACLCNADVFRFRDRYLVIDIKDGAPGPDARFEAALDQPAADGGLRLAPPNQLTLPLAEGVQAFRGVGISSAGPSPALTAQVQNGLPKPPLEAPSGHDPAEQHEQTAPNMTPLERQVIETLTRAASQGLLDLAPAAGASRMEIKGAEPKEAEHVTPAEAPHETAPAASHASDVAALPGLLAHTSLDEAQNIVLGGRPHANDGGLCWPEAFTDAAAWLDEDADFGSSIGSLRLAAMGELDRADPAGVLALARAYVFFGFGQEAMQALQIDGVVSRERLAVRAMAAVVDDLPQPDAVLAGQAGCPGPAALWAFLASEPGKTTSESEVDAIVREFKLLPDHLQVQLGPKLADQLLAVRQDASAEAVLQPAQRQENQNPELAMAETSLAVSRGQLEEATAALETMAADDPRMTPEAVIQLVDLKITQDQDIPDPMVALLEAMQFEYRGQPIVTDLTRARIAAMAQNGNFDAALDALPRLEGALQEPALSALKSTVIAGIAGQPDDMLFLDAAFRDIMRDVSPDVQNDVSQRLLELGFPDRAADLVSGAAIGSVMSERRYLRAEAAMALDDPALAAAHLAGIETPRATAILQGVPADTGVATEAAWRSGNWAALSQSDDPLLQKASALEQGATSPVPDTAAPLASGRALLEDAAQTKATLDALMNRFAAPADG